MNFHLLNTQNALIYVIYLNIFYLSNPSLNVAIHNTKITYLFAHEKSPLLWLSHSTKRIFTMLR